MNGDREARRDLGEEREGNGENGSDGTADKLIVPCHYCHLTVVGRVTVLSATTVSA